MNFMNRLQLAQAIHSGDPITVVITNVREDMEKLQSAQAIPSGDPITVMITSSITSMTEDTLR